MNIIKRYKNISATTIFVCLNMLLIYFNGATFFNLGSYYLFIGLTIISGIYLMIKSKEYYNPFQNKVIILILGYTVFITYFLRYGAAFDMLAATALFLIFIIIISMYKFNIDEVRIIIYSYMISAVVLAIILIVQRREPYIAVGVYNRFGVFYSSNEFYDVNFTAAYMLIPCLLLLYISLNSNNMKNRIISLSSYIIIFISIFLTGSRGAMLPLIACTFFLLIKYLKIKFRHIIIGILFIIFLILIIPNDLFSRYFAESYMDTNGRRFLDWQYGINAIQLRPLFGHGLYSSYEIIHENFNVAITSHNTILALFVQYGIVGMVLYLTFFCYPIYFFIKKKLFDLTLIYLSFWFTMIMIEANMSEIFIVPISIFYIIINSIKYNDEFNIINILINDKR